MATEKITQELFFNKTSLDETRVQGIVQDALNGMDDGELFLEFCQSENIVFDDGTLKNASFDTTHGFGLRAALGEVTGYAHASELSEEALKRAAGTVRSIRAGQNGAGDVLGRPAVAEAALYSDVNPLEEMTFDKKSALLQTIDTYLREKSSYVKQASISVGGNWQAVHIIRHDGEAVSDVRPLVRLNVSVVVEKDGRMERGSYGIGGRMAYEEYLSEERWKHCADKALKMALVNLESVPAPAGEFDVVLGPGWPGVLLHEAVGHGLEGDFNRKKTSAFAGLLGERVAAPGVTVVDDGTIANKRGSLTVDDEGTATGRNVLIEDGILKGYMQDRLNAKLMGVAPTGNGRRESFEHQILPRMTNTYMENGDKDPEEIIASVKNGIYATYFGGGQVDITSGKFVFSASEAYKIEDGKVTAPIKGATLIGNGPEVLKRVSMIGNDMELDEGIGTCGKDGQGVPVGVGQPTMLVNNLTIGGTEA